MKEAVECTMQWPPSNSEFEVFRRCRPITDESNQRLIDAKADTASNGGTRIPKSTMEHLTGLGFVLVSGFMGLVCGTGVAVAGEVKRRFRGRGQFLIWLAATALVLFLSGLAGFLKLQTSTPERFMNWAIAAVVLGFVLPFGIAFPRKRG